VLFRSVGLGGPSQTTTGSAKKITHTAFYANWGQFWPGAPNDNGRNSPNTFKKFIKNTDKVIYGFLMFGVMPTPFLICDSTTGTCIWDAYGGKFQKAKCWMGLVGGALGYTNEMLKVVADRTDLLYKIVNINTYKNKIIMRTSFMVTLMVALASASKIHQAPAVPTSSSLATSALPTCDKFITTNC
jgi:hypothetical protein